MWLIQHHIMKEFPKLKALHCKWGPQGKCGPLQSNTSEGVQNIGWILLWRRISTLTHPRTTDTQWSLFSLKSRTFGLGQTNWADKFWDIWGIWNIFGQSITTHFDTESPLFMIFIIKPLFLQWTKPLYPHPKYSFGIAIWIWAEKS